MGAFVNDLRVTVADMILRLVPRLMGALASDLRRTLPNLAPGHFQVRVAGTRRAQSDRAGGGYGGQPANHLQDDRHVV